MITLTSKTNDSHISRIEDSWDGGYQARILKGKRSLYSRVFEDKLDAIEWATDHLTKEALIERNAEGLTYGDAPSY